MNIVYQKSRGSYETDQIIISKNKEEVKKYVKAGCRGFSVSKKNIENRDIFQYINSFSVPDNFISLIGRHTIENIRKILHTGQSRT